MNIKSYDKVKASKLQEIVYRAEEFDFTEFLTLLRGALGITQKVLSQDTAIPDWKIHNWESGKFVRPPKYEHLVALADYFGISPRLLKKKALEYGQQGRRRRSSCYMDLQFLN